MDRAQALNQIVRVVASVSVLSIVAAACSDTEPDTTTSGASIGSSSVAVVASFYPLAYAAERVGGECVDVTNLTPPGVEPHDLELTPDDVEAVADSDVMLYFGGGFQPAVEETSTEAQGATLDLLSEVETVPAPPSEAEEGLTVDPHIWLDPGLFATTIPAVVDAMDEAAPDAPCDFQANGAALVGELEALDREFETGLAVCERTTVVTSHAAFGYLASAYGMTQESISGLAPDAEPTPARLAELVDLVQREGVTTVFSEELVSPEVADTLAAEAGVEVATLNTLEGLTPEEMGAGQDYGAVMRTNLETLRAALGCS